MPQYLSLKEYASDIHSKKTSMDGLWNNYTLVLLKNITLTERLYHHQVAVCQSNNLSIKLFGTMQLNIIRTGFLGPVMISYHPLIQGESILDISSSYINQQGLLDGVIPLSDKKQVFEHYLHKLLPVYEHMANLCIRDKE
jgi:formate hydrogenlyase regulatory protein HycA